MNFAFIILSFALVAAQFVLPRRFAFAPLLVAICHFQNVPVVHAGVSFSICKLVIVAGLLRALGEHRLNGLGRNPLDLLVAAWAGWLILSGLAHHPEDHNPMTIRFSVVYDFAGSYLYARCFLTDRESFVDFCKCLAVVLVPLALLVLVEKATGRSIYGLIGGGLLESEARGGRIRAAGPFGHSILLGSFGATSIPLIIALWRRQLRLAVIAGFGACALIVFSSASSGPIIALMSGALGLGLWRWRTNLRTIRFAAIGTIVVLHLVMQSPVWYLMGRIDLAGGSTGWHRAELITQGLQHLDEWWLVGTDHTRHWIAYGVGWSTHHADITNHYLQMGVTGGLPLMLCFIAILLKAFQMLGRQMLALREMEDPDEFILWCVGSALFAHCLTFLAIAYFDQNNAVLGLLLGSVWGLCSATVSATDDVDQTHEAGSEIASEIPGAGMSVGRLTL